jgi:signal transduction histidine kinase
LGKSGQHAFRHSVFPRRKVGLTEPLGAQWTARIAAMLERVEPDESLGRLRELAAEQAALRRVATLVAENTAPSEVFACVCAEVGGVLAIESTNLTRFEEDGTQTVLGGWSVHGAPVFPVGAGVPVDGNAAVAKVRRSGRPKRVDDYTGLEGEVPTRLRRAGIASAVAVPITVAGELWGAVIASSGRPRDFGPDTEERMAGFAELVADAVANADAREQLAASRARIVEVEDSERRRLGRNLHDGAQQRLVALALELRQVESQIDTSPEQAKTRLAHAREEPPRHSRSCASSRTGSTRGFSATVASDARSRLSSRARPWTSRSRLCRASGFPSPWRRPPTTWSPKPSPTSPSTPVAPLRR